MSKNFSKKTIFFIICCVLLFNIISVTPISDIKNDLEKKSFKEPSQPIITKSSTNLEEIGLTVGDIIISINNEEVNNQWRIRSLFDTNKGKAVSLQFIRDSKIEEIQTIVPDNFQAFGEKSDFDFQDYLEVKKNAFEIISYHLYTKQFEIDPFFPEMNKKVFQKRITTYISSIIIAIISYFFLFKTQKKNQQSK